MARYKWAWATFKAIAVPSRILLKDRYLLLFWFPGKRKLQGRFYQADVWSLWYTRFQWKKFFFIAQFSQAALECALQQRSIYFGFRRLIERPLSAFQTSTEHNFLVLCEKGLHLPSHYQEHSHFIVMFNRKFFDDRNSNFATKPLSVYLQKSKVKFFLRWNALPLTCAHFWANSARLQRWRVTCNLF